MLHASETSLHNSIVEIGVQIWEEGSRDLVETQRRAICAASNAPSMSTEKNRHIVLLGALLVSCLPAEAFLVNPSTAGQLRPTSNAVAAASKHAQGPVSLAGRRSRTGSALSMGAKSVRVSCIISGLWLDLCRHPSL